jgi:hypothetical protein
LENGRVHGGGTSDYGINHVYLTFDARQILGLSRVYDFTGLYYEGGVLFEF